MTLVMSSSHISEGKCGILDDMSYYIENFQKKLGNRNDEIPDQKNIILLEDLGYQKIFSSYDRWEKIEVDNEEEEVVEEIFIHYPEEPLRRRRTTKRKRTDYGKVSENITYKKLRIGKTLAAAINNSLKSRNKS